MPKPASPYAKRKCFYSDQDSHELGTGVNKRKYKLAGIQAEDSYSKLGILSYTYFVTTSQSYHSTKTTIKVEPHEMTHYLHRPMRRTATYIDVKQRERIFDADLQLKVTDPTNGFRKVAKLCDAKWIELEQKAPMILSQRVSDEVKRDVLRSLLGQSAAEDLLSNWGIS